MPAAAAWRHCGRYMVDPNGVGISVDVPSWASAQHKDLDPNDAIWALHGLCNAATREVDFCSPIVPGEVTPKCYAVFVEAYGKAAADCLVKPGKSTPRCAAVLEKLK